MPGSKNGKSATTTAKSATAVATPGKAPVASPSSRRFSEPTSNRLLLLIGLLGACLGVLFYQSFEPHQVLFANDGPLGAAISESNQLPGKFLGRWITTEWLGLAAPPAAPSLTNLFAWALPTVLFYKIYDPLTLLFLGFSVWLFLRQQGFHPMVCALMGLAAGLNMHFFSTACWGLGTINIATGSTFLALAALTTRHISQLWARAILAGLAVGLGMMEGFDVGAILSVYVGVFIVYKAFCEHEGMAARLFTAVGTEVLVVFFAAFIAAHTITGLVGTQVDEVVSAQQDNMTKQKQWNRDTQWSLPKIETLRLFTPGIFGYRMFQYINVSDHSSSYWGNVGQDPRIPSLMSDDPMERNNVITNMVNPPTAEELSQINSPDFFTRKSAVDALSRHLGMFPRQSGTGDYAGVLVAVFAMFGIANLFRREQSPYSPLEKKRIWFWTIAVVGSLLAAWGRHGFVYAWLYHLPYFSTIRNPIKFLDPFHVFWIILAACGLEALYRLYLKPLSPRPEAVAAAASGKSFEKKWFTASLVVAGIAVIAAVVYFNAKERLIAYLANHGFASDLAAGMATFSYIEVGWFLGFLFFSGWLVNHIITGAWRGAGMKTVWILTAAILIADLGRTDWPWIHYFDYVEKYSDNPVKDFLRQHKPYEYRVMGRLSPRATGSANSNPNNGKNFGPVYDFWMQNDFPAMEVQTLDFAQMPRMPKLEDAYLRNFQLVGNNITNADLFPSVRLWELTGTRYLLYDGRVVGMLNMHGDPEHQAFQILAPLEMVPKEGIYANTVADAGDATVRVLPPDTMSPIALMEYTNVLPRAKLFANWQTQDPTNTLSLLRSKNFDPQLTVLVATNAGLAQASSDSLADPGTVEITDYHPKNVTLSAEAKTPAVLLLNDRYARDWHVQVDHQPAKMLQCNYIMRGVYLTPGQHTVEFRYRPSIKALYFSLGGWASGLLLAGYLVVTRKKTPAVAA